jgi:hypothetical protein
MFVHGFDNLAETIIAEAKQYAAIDQVRIHSGPDEKYEDVFEEAIESGLAAGKVGGGLGEEEFESGGEFGEGVEGDDEWLGEGGGKGVQHASAELDGCANELGAFLF